MNNKLVFVSIIAIVTAFAASSVVAGLGIQMLDARKDSNCQNDSGDGVNVNANVCSVKVCANADVLGSNNPKKCDQ